MRQCWLTDASKRHIFFIIIFIYLIYLTLFSGIVDILEDIKEEEVEVFYNNIIREVNYK